ncbi:methylthioribulose-1-phosphate dehydratase [Jimgerdemannia flammicorona]|uniref:Methylthioribulose-1-phosphate dehydratase n=1 Tax=Jimgerdemannia flammicorona TaxID=994334 RepID=A0A433DDD1_9FUNG|nr:methylthioribulose-1-phosphate dehydratase [Jimgerdemannia flammicorona]
MTTPTNLLAPTTNPDELVRSSDPNHPANLIPELCSLFYTLGWVTGTGSYGHLDALTLSAFFSLLPLLFPAFGAIIDCLSGGISIRKDDHVFLAPSGVQKERIQPKDLFVMTLASRTLLRQPLVFKPSACTPLFYNAYTMRHAGACIHTHSQNAVMATLLYPSDTFQITHQEMIKGIRRGSSGTNLRYFDTLVVPIVENTPEEENLTERMAVAMQKHPETNAVLVRRHGVYVWGENWEKAKTMSECYDYLFEIAVKMKSIGLDPAAKPAGEPDYE